MRTIKVSLTYYDVIHMMQADAKRLAEAEKLSHSDTMEHVERMQKYPAMLKEAWGTGFGRD